MNLTVLRGEQGFDELGSEWNDLLARSRAGTIFLSWEWQTTWWRHWGRGELYLLAWRDGPDERLVALAPLYAEDLVDGSRRLLLVGGIEVSDYLDFMIATGYEEQVFEAFAVWLGSPEAPAWDRVELVNVPASSCTVRCAPGLIVRTWPVKTHREDVCPVLELPDDWEAYLAQLEKHQRHEVRRKLRKIEQTGSATWWITTSRDDLARDVESFLALHQLSSADKDDFMTGAMQDYFRDLARVMFDSGRLALATLSIDGRPAAAMFNLVWEDQWLLYNSGYDPTHYSDLSTGIVLLAYCIQTCIEQKVKVLDFLQGDEVYKYRLGGRDTEVWRLVISRA